MKRGLGFGVAILLFALGAPERAEGQWVWTPQTGRFVNLKRLPKETPELQVEHARSLLVRGEYKQAIRETDKFEAYYGDSEYADENQFLRGEIRLAQGKYTVAAKEFQQVVSNYPESDRYGEVISKQYDIGDRFYAEGQRNLDRGWWHLFRKRPFKNAIEVYNLVIDNEPFTPEAAQAQYKVGLCHFTLKEYIEAAYEYRRVVEDYSTSDWVDEASHDLAMCYYEASLPPDYDQSPSQLAVNAMDDFLQRYPGDERETDMEGKREEMRERIAQQRLNTARFYEKRQKYDAARIYYEVVVKQFPETQAAQEAQKWLGAAGQS